MFTRGLEYLVLFFAAGHLVKEDYGELEFYKKIIEVGSSFFAFGFPALILSYTKSKESKVYFYILSILFVFLISLISIPFISYNNWIFLLIPFMFYALFFNGGITPAFLLVFKGSNHASYYKIIISVLFYSLVFISIYFFDVKGLAYVDVNYILFPLAIIYLVVIVIKQKLVVVKLKRYWGLFKKLLTSSFTLVVSNFANLMFLYTDIFIIKLLSNNANTDIANYSFALNIANILILIPLTLVQVDIEKLKNNIKHFKELNKKIILLVIIAAVFLIGGFLLLTNTLFYNYNDIFILFLIILLAKMIQSISPIYGAMLVIYKKFNTNLIINISMLIINVLLSYLFYYYFDIIGVAIASVISLGIRQIILFKVYHMIFLKKNS